MIHQCISIGLSLKVARWLPKVQASCPHTIIFKGRNNGVPLFCPFDRERISFLKPPQHIFSYISLSKMDSHGLPTFKGGQGIKVLVCAAFVRKNDRRKGGSLRMTFQWSTNSVYSSLITSALLFSLNIEKESENRHCLILCTLTTSYPPPVK